MENIKKIRFYKSALSLLTTASMFLMGGCSASTYNTGNSESNSANDSVSHSNEIENSNEDFCKHVTLYFKEGLYTFKECEGYEIYTLLDGTVGGECCYRISKNGELLMSGDTMQYNISKINHNIADAEIDIESIQKVKK